MSTILTNTLKLTSHWAINPFPNGLTSKIKRTSDKTISQIREEANKNEKEWGNSMIGQQSNGNWTTLW